MKTIFTPEPILIIDTVIDAWIERHAKHLLGSVRVEDLKEALIAHLRLEEIND